MSGCPIYTTYLATSQSALSLNQSEVALAKTHLHSVQNDHSTTGWLPLGQTQAKLEPFRVIQDPEYWQSDPNKEWQDPEVPLSSSHWALSVGKLGTTHIPESGVCPPQPAFSDSMTVAMSEPASNSTHFYCHLDSRVLPMHRRHTLYKALSLVSPLLYFPTSLRGRLLYFSPRPHKSLTWGLSHDVSLWHSLVLQSLQKQNKTKTNKQKAHKIKLHIVLLFLLELVYWIPLASFGHRTFWKHCSKCLICKY